jgi:drug/metabolite transporter (DMT)-like permease
LGKCQVSIAIWHFTATTIVLYISSCRPCRAFEAVRLPVRQVLPICVFFASFLLLGNLSLALNSVDFYQLAKIMTTPTVVALNFMLFRKCISSSALAAVLVSCLGVGLVSTPSFHANLLGCIVATAAFTVTALYQIWIGKKIEDLNISPPQLLLNQAPVSVVLLLLIAPFVDTIPDFTTIPSNILYSLFLSGLVASLLNLSQFFIIGRTSTLTFNVVSQVKTIMIIGISWMSTGKHLDVMEVSGVVLALGGAWFYTQFSRR